MYCPYPEILEYLLGVARKYDLERRTKFRTAIKSARWDEEKRRWLLVARNIDTDIEFTHECKILISGTGQHGTPRTMADLEAANCELFEGPVVHAARWDHSVDLHGKRVVVVGNGCTAAQIVPAIADRVNSVVQLSRSRHWLVPDQRLPHQGYMRFFASRLPFFQKFFRLFIAFFLEIQWPYFTKSFLGHLMRSHFQKEATEYVRKMAPKKYHKILIPDFPFGCKRRVLDENGQYAAVLHKPNVALHEENIVKHVPGRRLILATGFRGNDGGLAPLPTAFFKTNDRGFSYSILRIYGRASIPLDEYWRKEFGGPAAYETVAVNGFPNYFIIFGPNSNTGHTSAIIGIENGVNLVLKLIKPILKGHNKTIEISAIAERAYHDKVQAKLKKTVFGVNCGAWYMHGGHNSSTYPWSAITRWWHCTFPQWRDWVLV
ncbi:4-hydroxyacetophenone monooxygenase [Auriculariales sp. MPI-PUGE-AT-0066]|nr:4-hydroxyacetophenone monooxygenase [Auriculariales sp. MPI-PUGE-AT-0066]